LGVTEITKPSLLAISQQQVPGSLLDEADELQQKGLPDLAIFDDENWAVLFECKVQAKVAFNQLERHRMTAQRNGYPSPWIVVLSVDNLPAQSSPKTIFKTWRDVYSWFNLRAADSFWARQLVDFMRAFEQKMLSRDYQIRGTITVFDGLRFDDKDPYSYREAKRLLRLMGDLLQDRKDLQKIAVDPEEAFVASLSSCHMLWFLSIAAKRKFRIDRYRDVAVGVMNKNAEGRMCMLTVTLNPEVQFSGDVLPTSEEIHEMHHEAHDQCFIANSVKTEVRCVPVILAH
jgi:organic hydroperoxide reductase OsmC/OhrA